MRCFTDNHNTVHSTTERLGELDHNSQLRVMRHVRRQDSTLCNKNHIRLDVPQQKTKKAAWLLDTTHRAHEDNPDTARDRRVYQSNINR